MLARRVLFVSMCATIAGVGFALPAFANPPQGGGISAGSQMAARSYPSSQGPRGQYAYTQGSATAPYHRRFAGYPCTWSGSRDLAHGETAYRSGRYVEAAAKWKAAASKDCAIAAYKLGMLYYGGKFQVNADRSLGAAWLRLAAESKTASNPYYQQMSQQAVANLTEPQRARYVADYAKLSGSLDPSTVR
jgi:hypothetical protein